MMTFNGKSYYLLIIVALTLLITYLHYLLLSRTFSRSVN